MIYLEEGDAAELSRAGVRVWSIAQAKRSRASCIRPTPPTKRGSLGPYQHFMQRKFHEQPRAVSDTLDNVVNEGVSAELFGEHAAADFCSRRGVC